jgi:hypothetical protein
MLENIYRALGFQPGGLLEPATDAKRGPTLPPGSTVPLFRSLRTGEPAMPEICGWRSAPRASSPSRARACGVANLHAIARGIGRAIERIGPPSAAATARHYEEQRVRDRLKAAAKVGELQTERYRATRRGDLAEVEKLSNKLAAAHRDYRDLGGTA